MASCHHCQKIKNKRVRGNVCMVRKKKIKKERKMHVKFKGENG